MSSYNSLQVLNYQITFRFMNGNLNFPDVIGAIDCTHIAIVPPKIDDPIHPAVAYINRKGYHSLNVQAVSIE